MSAPAGVYAWESFGGVLSELTVDERGEVLLECPLCGDAGALTGHTVTVDAMGRPTVDPEITCPSSDCGWRGWIRNGVECGSADEEAS